MGPLCSPMVMIKVFFILSCHEAKFLREAIRKEMKRTLTRRQACVFAYWQQTKFECQEGFYCCSYIQFFIYLLEENYSRDLSQMCIYMSTVAPNIFLFICSLTPNLTYITQGQRWPSYLSDKKVDTC